MHCYVKSLRSVQMRCENVSNFVTEEKCVTNRKCLRWERSELNVQLTCEIEIKIIVIKVEMLPYHPNCVDVQKWWIANLCNSHAACSHVLLEVCQTSDWQKVQQLYRQAMNARVFGQTMSSRKWRKQKKNEGSPNHFILNRNFGPIHTAHRCPLFWHPLFAIPTILHWSMIETSLNCLIN